MQRPFNFTSHNRFHFRPLLRPHLWFHIDALLKFLHKRFSNLLSMNMHQNSNTVGVVNSKIKMWNQHNNNLFVNWHVLFHYPLKHRRKRLKTLHEHVFGTSCNFDVIFTCISSAIMENWDRRFGNIVFVNASSTWKINEWHRHHIPGTDAQCERHTAHVMQGEKIP
jgi:hypothetical protein